MGQVIRYDLAAIDIEDTGASIKLIDGKYCMTRSDVIFYDAPTKEALIEAYFHNNMEDYTYNTSTNVGSSESPSVDWSEFPEFPKLLLSIHLPLEPLQHERSYCLRQLSETKWCTCYCNESGNSYYYGHYFFSFKEALVEFQTELNRQTERLSYHVKMFYKYRNYINRKESEK